VNQSGVAVQQFVSTSPKLFEPFKDEDIHGGPPVIHVPAQHSTLGRDYYLGIFHFFKVWLPGHFNAQATGDVVHSSLLRESSAVAAGLGDSDSWAQSLIQL
jgi:hypothetical protein